jgi:hypothetical protein
MQRQGVRGGELARREAGRGLNPDGAQAGGSDAAGGPDLADEGDDRGFAVGAGHRHRHFGLGRELPGGGARIDRAHVGDEHHRRARIAVEGPVGNYSHRALRHGLRREAVAVNARTREREKHLARFDRAAVGVDAFDLQRGRPLADRAFEQLCQCK